MKAAITIVALLLAGCTPDPNQPPAPPRIDDVALSPDGSFAALSWCVARDRLHRQCHLVRYDFASDEIAVIASPAGNRHLVDPSFAADGISLLAVDVCWQLCAFDDGRDTSLVKLGLDGVKVTLANHIGFIRYPIEDPKTGAITVAFDGKRGLSGFADAGGLQRSGSGLRIATLDFLSRKYLVLPPHEADHEELAEARQQGKYYTAGFAAVTRPSLDADGSIVFSAETPPSYLHRQILDAARPVSGFFPIRLPPGADKAELHPVFRSPPGCYDFLTATEAGTSYFSCPKNRQLRRWNSELRFYKAEKFFRLFSTKDQVLGLHVARSAVRLAFLVGQPMYSQYETNLYSIDLVGLKTTDHNGVSRRLKSMFP